MTDIKLEIQNSTLGQKAKTGNYLLTPKEMKERIKETAKKVAKEHGMSRKDTRTLIKLTTVSLMGTGA